MAPSTAMVNAEGSSMFTVAMSRTKPCGAGMSVLMVPKRSPMVSTEYHGNSSPSSQARAVTAIMAISAPGSFLEMRGVAMMMASDTSAVATVGREMALRLVRYMPHLGMKDAGISRRPSPRKSLTWVENMVSAIPAVKPTTTG